MSVERVINAPASEIFALVADAGKHASFDGSGTVQHATQESMPLAKGSKFGMSMRWGLPYRTTNTVIEYEPDRRIAWQTTMLGGLVGGRIWRYELEPADGGAGGPATSNARTLVRETWDISRDKQALILKNTGMPKQAEQGMRATLERIAEIVEKR
ncbi:MAG TPA: SRPBCC family protein [Mycobacterium sp.]|nr:SRPBCC family protein [Mycobacterium sp.]